MGLSSAGVCSSRRCAGRASKWSGPSAVSCFRPRQLTTIPLQIRTMVPKGQEISLSSKSPPTTCATPSRHTRPHPISCGYTSINPQLHPHPDDRALLGRVSPGQLYAEKKPPTLFGVRFLLSFQEFPTEAGYAGLTQPHARSLTRPQAEVAVGVALEEEPMHWNDPASMTEQERFKAVAAILARGFRRLSLSAGAPEKAPGENRAINRESTGNSGQTERQCVRKLT